MSSTAGSTRRQELLAIAAELFAARGFANVTVDEIGHAAGVSGPALYHHFAGKEALLGEMLVGVSRRLLDGARRIAADGIDVVDRLVAFHCDFAVSDRPLITVQVRDLIYARSADQRRVRRLQAQYALVWVDAVTAAHPGVDRTAVRTAVHATFGLINSTPFSATLPRTDTALLLATMASAALASLDRTTPDQRQRTAT